MPSGFVSNIFYLIFCLTLTIYISGCDAESDKYDSHSNTGSATFNIIWPGDLITERSVKAAGSRIDCVEKDISTISVTVTDNTGIPLTDDSFSCTDGEGVIDNIPAGQDRYFIVSGENSDGHIVYQGEKANISIIGGQTTEIGYIEMARFNNATPVVSIASPGNGSLYNEGDIINFSGSWKDEDDDLLLSAITWSSDIEGELGNGLSIATTQLTKGKHIISLSITDTDGDTGIASIVVFIGVPASFSNRFGMTFNYIPAGTFIMGSPEDEYGRGDDEEQHEVNIPRFFYIQTTEVTQGQWRDVIEEAVDKGIITTDDIDSTPSNFTQCGDDCPVEKISWDETQLFINALNQLDEGTFCLPTEAQWEYSARAESTTAFANGPITEAESIDDPVLELIGWYARNSYVSYEGCSYMNSTTLYVCVGPNPVAQKMPNNWGLYDMHGSVWEWVEDDYHDSYEGASVNGNAWVDTPRNSNRVVRGGSWFGTAINCRSANRYWYGPNYTRMFVGFRLVLIPNQP